MPSTCSYSYCIRQGGGNICLAVVVATPCDNRPIRPQRNAVAIPPGYGHNSGKPLRVSLKTAIRAPANHCSIRLQGEAVKPASRNRYNVIETSWHTCLTAPIVPPANDSTIFLDGQAVIIP